MSRDKGYVFKKYQKDHDSKLLLTHKYRDL